MRTFHSLMGGGRGVALAVLALDGPRFATGCRAGCSSARGCTRLTVDLLANALHRALQVIGCGAHTRKIAARKRSAHGLDLVLHLAAQARRYPVTDILQRPFRLVRQAIGTVARLNLLAALAVLLSVQFGFAHHALDLLLGQAAGGRNLGLLLAPGCLIACRDIKYALGIAIADHLNLWYAPWGRRNAFKAEATQALVVARQFALPLHHVNLHPPLPIFPPPQHPPLAYRNVR